MSYLETEEGEPYKGYSREELKARIECLEVALARSEKALKDGRKWDFGR